MGEKGGTAQANVQCFESRGLLEMAVLGGKGVDTVLSQRLAHLRTGRIGDEPLGLQNRAQEVDSPQVVLQGLGRAGLDDAVADQLCIQGLQAALCLQTPTQMVPGFLPSQLGSLSTSQTHVQTLTLRAAGATCCMDHAHKGDASSAQVKSPECSHPERQWQYRLFLSCFYRISVTTAKCGAQA